MKHCTQKAFTLVEMVTVLAIFGIISSIVIFNYNKFQSDTVLTNMAYEIALSIREAQIYGVSARTGSTPDFKTAYGVYIVKDSGQYILFSDEGATPNKKFDGTSCSDTGGDICVKEYTLQRNVKINEIKVNAGTSNQCEEPTDNTGVSILFKRPNPEPIITLNTGGADHSFVEMTVSAPNGTPRYVTVYNNGQIAVFNEQNRQCQP